MFRAPPLTPLVKILLVGLFGAFVVQAVLARSFGIDAAPLLAIHAGDGLGVATLWQVVTHVLVHGADSGALVSLMITLLFLWWMGAPFEARFGPRETLKLLGTSTLAAGIVGVAGTLLLGGAVAGSGPWLCALITGYAAAIPAGAQLSFFGVLPMKRNTLIWVMVGMIVFMSYLEGAWASMLANLAALGAGWLYMKWRLTPRRPKATRRKKGGSGRFQVIKGGLDDDDDDDRPKYLN